jgi:hypothetical protein
MSEAVAEQAVIATFESPAAAEQAAKDLMGWDKANDDVKLGAIGVFSKNDKGELKTKNYSQRNTGKGAKIGMGLGVAAAVFSGGLTLIPSVVGGAVAGGAAGTLFRKGLGLSDEEKDKLNAQLDGGKAALLVMCNDNEVAATTEYLKAAGGEPQSHPVQAADLEEAAKAAESATPAAESSTPASPPPASS